MSKFVKFSVLSVILIVLSANFSFAQNQDTSWIYGIWYGEFEFKRWNGGPRIDFKINEKGFTAEFKYRQCKAEWILEEINDKTARFREKIIKDKATAKLLNNHPHCMDGATVELKLSYDKNGRQYLGYAYYLPNSEDKSSVGLFSASIPYYGTDDYYKYFATKVGGYTVNRRYITEIRQLGMKVADIKFPVKKRESTGDSDITFDYPIVVAIQEGSPAFYAGVVPGDIVVSLGSRWSLKDSRSFSDAVALEASTKISNLLMVYYEVSDSPYVETTGFTLPFNNSNERGKWITEVPVHRKNARTVLSAVKEANAAAKKRYADYEKEVATTIINNPCRISNNQISTMAARLNDLATMSGDIGEGENREKHLTETSQAICDNSRDGGLTKIEAAFLAIAFRQIEPCKYSPSEDYSGIFNDFKSIKFYSRKGYNDYFSRRLDRLSMPEAQQICFDKLLRAAFGLSN